MKRKMRGKLRYRLIQFVPVESVMFVSSKHSAEKKTDFVDKISSVPVKPPMLQRWTAETHMRRWNFNAADPDSNLLLNRDVSR